MIRKFTTLLNSEVNINLVLRLRNLDFIHVLLPDIIVKSGTDIFTSKRTSIKTTSFDNLQNFGVLLLTF